MKRILSAIVILAALAIIFGVALQKFTAARAAESARARSTTLIIRNGHIIDGTGSPWYSADIAIRDGRIAAHRPPRRRRPRNDTIDAHGRVVAPGFIDMLGQSDLTILVDPRLPSKIYQGITTEVTGEGSSVAPLTRRDQSDAIISRTITTRSRPIGAPSANISRVSKSREWASTSPTYVGATTVRAYVIGDADRAPTAAELDQMRAHVRQAMQEGARRCFALRCNTPPPPMRKQKS